MHSFFRVLSFSLLVTFLTGTAKAQNKPELSVTKTHVGAFGHYNRPEDSLANTSVRIECRKSTMECIETIAVAGAGRHEHPSIHADCYSITTWNENELVAELDGECFVQKITIVFGDRSVVSMDVPKKQPNLKSCEDHPSMMKTSVFELVGN